MLRVYEQKQWQREARVHCLAWRWPPPPHPNWQSSDIHLGWEKWEKYCYGDRSKCWFKHLKNLNSTFQRGRRQNTRTLFVLTERTVTRKILQYVLSLGDALKTKMDWLIQTLPFDTRIALMDSLKSVTIQHHHCFFFINHVTGVIFSSVVFVLCLLKTFVVRSVSYILL